MARIRQNRINGVVSQCIAPTQEGIEKATLEYDNMLEYHLKVREGINLLLQLYNQIINEVGMLKLNFDCASPPHWRSLNWFLEQYPTFAQLDLPLSYGGEIFCMKIFFTNGIDQLVVLRDSLESQIPNKLEAITTAKEIYSSSLNDYDVCVENEIDLIQNTVILTEVETEFKEADTEFTEAVTELTDAEKLKLMQEGVAEVNTLEAEKSKYMPFIIGGVGLGAMFLYLNRNKSKKRK